MNSIVAGTFPMVILAGSFGAGRFATGVDGEGLAPVASDGVTCPSPVMKRMSVSPLWPLEKGTSARFWSMKIPGADAATWKVYDAVVCPLFTTSTAVPGETS